MFTVIHINLTFNYMLDNILNWMLNYSAFTLEPVFVLLWQDRRSYFLCGGSVTAARLRAADFNQPNKIITVLKRKDWSPEGKTRGRGRGSREGSWTLCRKNSFPSFNRETCRNIKRWVQLFVCIYYISAEINFNILIK